MLHFLFLSIYCVVFFQVLTTVLTQIHSKFSFGKLPSPLQANSQKVALKLVATSKRIRHLLEILSYEEFIEKTGLTEEKLEKIFRKSEHIEQKLIEGSIDMICSGLSSSGISSFPNVI